MDKPEPPVGIDPELQEQAARLGLDIGGFSENALRLHLQKVDPAGGEARARRWAEENAEAIRHNNDSVARRGVFGADLRRW